MGSTEPEAITVVTPSWSRSPCVAKMFVCNAFDQMAVKRQDGEARITIKRKYMHTRSRFSTTNVETQPSSRAKTTEKARGLNNSQMTKICKKKSVKLTPRLATDHPICRTTRMKLRMPRLGPADLRTHARPDLFRPSTATRDSRTMLTFG